MTGLAVLRARRVRRVADDAHRFYGVAPGSPLPPPLHPAEMVYGPLWVPQRSERLTVRPTLVGVL